MSKENLETEIKPEEKEVKEIIEEEVKPEEKEKPKKDATKIEKTFQSHCIKCGLDLVSESQKRADELLAIHQLDHKNEKPKNKKDLFDGNPLNMSFTAMLALTGICFAIGLGFLLHHGKKKYDDETKEKSK